MKETLYCLMKGGCEFMIKNGVKLCIHCSKIEYLVPPMCEIMGKCDWISRSKFEICIHCGTIRSCPKCSIKLRSSRRGILDDEPPKNLPFFIPERIYTCKNCDAEYSYDDLKRAILDDPKK